MFLFIVNYLLFCKINFYIFNYLLVNLPAGKYNKLQKPQNKLTHFQQKGRPRFQGGNIK